MDANGSRFHLLTGMADWSSPNVTISAEAGAGHDASWDLERGALSLSPRVFVPREAQAIARSVEVRRGAAADRYGNVYRIADDRRSILVRSSGSQVTGVLWPRPAREDAAPGSGGFADDAAGPAREEVVLSGLAITPAHRMVVGYHQPTTKEAGLVVFDLFSPAPPVWVEWPLGRTEGGSFEPFDIAATPDGGVLVLDRANRRLWGVDAALQAMVRPSPEVLRASSFAPVTGSPTGPADTSVAPAVDVLEPLHRWPATDDPVALEVLSADSAVVLVNRGGQPFAAVHVVRPFAASVEILSTDVLKDRLAPKVGEGFELVGHDMAATASRDAATNRAARLYVLAAGGLQAYAFDLVDAGPKAAPRYSLTASAGYYPLYGATDRALIVFKDRPYHDAGERWALLTERPRRRFRHAAGVTTGALDGKTPGCVWHRILVDGVVPRGAGLRIFTRTAESAVELAHAPWREEPVPVLRADGPEIPHVQRERRTGASLPDEAGTFDTLLQAAQGRYLQLRIELSGDGTTTPYIRALRLYYPRFSYLERYLPAAYRADATSASLLDRWLSIFEGFYTPIEDRIAAAQGLFDVRSASVESLEWLASWLGVVLDPAWDEARRRLFLRHAADFFRMRGTVRGVVTALELALSEHPGDHLFDADVAPARRGIRIVEKFTSRRLPGVVAGDPSESDGLRELAVDGVWRPPDGRAGLTAKYRTALASAGIALAHQPTVFPVREPGDGTRPLWRTFCKHALGFVPLAVGADAPAWRAFLLRRYGTPAELTAAHREPYATFDDVAVPVELPADGAPLVDWYQFEGQLAIARYAHQFVVVLPVRPGDAAGTEAYQARLELAQRIAALEKPAHTTFAARFYWAMFRVGEARLGSDSVVDRDAAAKLLGPFILDRSYLAEGHLAPRPPADAVDRSVLGRDALRVRARAEET